MITESEKLQEKIRECLKWGVKPMKVFKKMTNYVVKNHLDDVVEARCALKSKEGEKC